MKNDFKINEIVYHIIYDLIYVIEEIEILDDKKIYYLNNFEKIKTCSGFENLFCYDDYINYRGSSAHKRWEEFEIKNGFCKTSVKKMLNFLLQQSSK